MTSQSPHIPKLRFSGFSEPWEKAVLGDIATFSKGKGISKKDIDPEGQTYCIRYGELYTTYDTIIDEPVSKTSVAPENLNLSKGGEVIVPASGETAEDIATAAVVLREGVALGGDLNIIRSDLNGAFLASYLSGKKRMPLASMAQGNSVVHLYPTQLSSLSLSVPSRLEQDKISSSLKLLDEKISLLNNKSQALDEYRKKCMKLIFSQAMRFRDDDGNEFPEWEMTTIGDVGHFYYGKSAPKFSLSPDAPTPCVRYGELYTKFGVIIDNVESRTNIDPSKLRFSKGGEILVPRVGEDPLDFAACCCFLPLEGIAIGEMISVFNTDENPIFYTYYFRTLRREFARVVEGGNVSNLYYSYLEPIEVGKPHPKEQEKIGEFFMEIDRLLALVSEELEHAQAFKKGLLQQMFI